MENNSLHKLGIDIGSTTVKIALLDDQEDLLFSDYERHFANIQETLELPSSERPTTNWGTLPLSDDHRFRRTDSCKAP